MHRSLIIYAFVVLVFVFNNSARQSLAATTANLNAEPLDPVVDYQIDFSDSKNHYLNISAKFSVSESSTELMMATWAPGSYLVREYARHVDSMTMTDQDSKPVSFHKTQKNRWTANTDKVKTLHINYRLYCNEMTVRTNWTGRSYSVINGPATFITLVGKLDQPHRVTLNLPTTWKRSACALPKTDRAHQYVADNYDQLVDNPIVAGNVSIYPFDVAGVPHQLVNVGEAGYWDGDRAAADLKKMVAAHHKMWSVVPYEKYMFINVIAEAGGGLEHDNCTMLMTSRWNFRDPKKYEDWLSLASHEFFHTWNVRRLRPKTLTRYDYEREIYTQSLWIAEGITSYYEDLALVRAGLIDPEAYVGRLSKNIERIQAQPGRSVQSLTDSSFDTWIKFYRPDENSVNTRISYYSKGAVAAFLLDAKIQQLTDGDKSLDDVMRKMYQDFVPTGYTPEDFRRTASQIAGQDLDDWFKQSIDSTAELDYQTITFLGVQIKGVAEVPVSEADKKKRDGEPTTADDSDADPTDDQQPISGEKKDNAKPWVGIKGTADGNSVKVSAVTPGSPAYLAGVLVGDEILAINDFRLRGDLSRRLKQYQIGETLEFLIARRGRLLPFDVPVATGTKQVWKLSISKSLDDERQQRLNAWLKISP